VCKRKAFSIFQRFFITAEDSLRCWWPVAQCTVWPPLCCILEPSPEKNLASLSYRIFLDWVIHLHSPLKDSTKPFSHGLPGVYTQWLLPFQKPFTRCFAIIPAIVTAQIFRVSLRSILLAVCLNIFRSYAACRMTCKTLPRVFINYIQYLDFTTFAVFVSTKS
jgi:hypothetical protein